MADLPIMFDSPPGMRRRLDALSQAETVIMKKGRIAILADEVNLLGLNTVIYSARFDAGAVTTLWHLAAAGCVASILLPLLNIYRFAGSAGVEQPHRHISCSPAAVEKASPTRRSTGAR